MLRSWGYRALWRYPTVPGVTTRERREIYPFRGSGRCRKCGNLANHDYRHCGSDLKNKVAANAATIYNKVASLVAVTIKIQVAATLMMVPLFLSRM